MSLYSAFTLKAELVSHIPCTEYHLCWLWCHQREQVDPWGIWQVLEVVLVDTQTLRVCCCFHEMRPHSCTLHRHVRSTASFAREPVTITLWCVYMSHYLYDRSRFWNVYMNYCWRFQKWQIMVREGVAENDLWRNLCKSLLYFLVRVQCRRKESSRSLSHLLMSFLLGDTDKSWCYRVLARRKHSIILKT